MARSGAAKKKAAKKAELKRPRGRPKKRWLDDYAAVGPPPSDPLARIKWIGDLLAVSLHKIIQDPHIGEERRTQEIKSHARQMRDLVPDTRRWEAERRVMEWQQSQAAPAGPSEGSEDLVDAATTAEPPLAAGPRREA